MLINWQCKSLSKSVNLARRTRASFGEATRQQRLNAGFFTGPQINSNDKVALGSRAAQHHG